MRAIAVGDGSDNFSARLLNAGIEFVPVSVSRKGIAPIGDAVLCVSLIRLFRRLRPALVHSFTIKPAIYATFAAAMTGVPSRVVTITGLGYAFTSASRPVRLLVKWLYSLALRYATIVFFQNSEDRSLFVAEGLVHPHQARLIAGSGVDISKFSPVALPMRSKGRPTFLMISRLLVDKGVLDFVAAAELVHRSYPSVEFTLVGPLDSRNPSSLGFEQVNRIVNGAHVNWVGEAEEVTPWLAHADVVVLPSYREGVPRVLLEASAMGRAVIATDVVGCRDAVLDGETGILVPVRDPLRLAEAMISLIEHPAKIEQMGKAGRRLIEDRFDERAIIQTTIACYRELGVG